ncbi:hypothetical protein EIY89_17850 [Shewanella algae]|nr:hypothetical protein EIY89_17850 [Shewanella algae]QQO85074.1 hypothetical protein D7032_18580 [Shewanella algae]UYA17393.1 hypothetical protein D3X10_17150 [Shewanella algae]
MGQHERAQCQQDILVFHSVNYCVSVENADHMAVNRHNTAISSNTDTF